MARFKFRTITKKGRIKPMPKFLRTTGNRFKTLKKEFKNVQKQELRAFKKMKKR